MRVWRPDETRELVELWPIASASQIAKKFQRPRSAIASKALRLRDEGLLPCDVIKHFDVNPQKRRKPRGLPKPPSSGIWDTVSQIGPHHPDAAVLDPRARYRPLSLAPRQRQRSCNRVLRRCGHAEQVLLRAPPAGRV